MNDETAIATLGKVQTPGPQTAGEVLVQAVGRRWAGIPAAPSPQAVSRLRRWPSPIRPPRPQPAAGRSTPPPPPARHPGASTVRDTGHPAIAAVGGSPAPAATRSPSGPPTRPDAGRTLRAAVPHPRQPLLRGISSPPASGAAAGGRSRRSLCPAGTRRRHDAAAVGLAGIGCHPPAQPRASGTPDRAESPDGNRHLQNSAYRCLDRFAESSSIAAIFSSDSWANRLRPTRRRGQPPATTAGPGALD